MAVFKVGVKVDLIDIDAAVADGPRVAIWVEANDKKEALFKGEAAGRKILSDKVRFTDALRFTAFQADQVEGEVDRHIQIHT